MSVQKKVNLLLQVQKEAEKVCALLEDLAPHLRLVDTSFLRRALIEHNKYAATEVPSLPGETSR